MQDNENKKSHYSNTHSTNAYFDENELIKLIKKNLKIKKNDRN